MAALASVPSEAAATTVSTFTKAGIDLTHPSTADSATGAHGSAQPGDTIKWVLKYANNTSSTAHLDITDPITGPQTYVANSLQTPPTLTGKVSGKTISATGSVPAGTTSAVSPPFSVSTSNFTTPGGDGYSVEGFGANLYTVFHHTDGTSTGNQTVFCATLDNQVCVGWPAYSTFVDPTAGTPLGTGTDGKFITATENGSMIVKGRLYWPVQSMELIGGSYPLGMQCLDLVSRQSCGFTLLATTKQPEGGAAWIAGDGIAASDGHYYYIVNNGDLLCFDPATGSCGKVKVSGPATNIASIAAELETFGDYVFAVAADRLGGSPDRDQLMMCFNVTTGSPCPGFPKAIGPTKFLAIASIVAPVVSSTGALLGACAILNDVCFDLSGGLISDPYDPADFNPDNVALGTGVLLGTKYYAIARQDFAGCFDFAQPLVGGKVQPCSEFTGKPRSEFGYTVRPLANLPGCMAADGDHAQIAIFNAVTGEPCSSASQSVKLTPNDYYCDGQPGHATSWGAVSLPGLTGSEYARASLTLLGADGSPLPGWTDVAFPAGSNTMDISSIPVSGNTATLTAQVNVSAVTDTAAVNASHVELSWKGDGIQVCYETVLPPVPCATAAAISNTATAVTTAGSVSDAPNGNSTGAVVFDVAPADAACMLHFTKRATPSPAKPGDRVTYTITVHNVGTADYETANPATFTDDISDVLADSVYRNDAAASAGTVVYDSNTHVLSWSGPLAAGATATVTYTVTVNDPDAGDHEMVNRVVSTNPSNCQAGSSDPDCRVNVPIPGLKVTKTSDPASGATVVPGQVITYTVAFQNDGRATATGIDRFDDLSDVLDDATVTSPPVASNSDLVVGPITNGRFEITGSVPAGATYTVTYAVTVKPDGQRGNNTAANFVLKPGANPPPQCLSGDPLCTVHYVPELHDWKTVDPASGTQVVPGQTLAFMLHFANRGAAPGAVDKVDDITQALDDAVVTSQPTSSNAALSVTTFGSDHRAHITGTLQPGQAVTITYKLRVNDPDSGDSILANFLMKPSDSPPTTPTCVPTDKQEPDCTTNPVGDLRVTKSVNPKNFSDVHPGQVLTFTLRFEQVGAAPARVDYTDHLSRVLDDATVVSAPHASQSALSVSGIRNGAFRIWGTLAVRQTVTVSYEVKVKDYDAQGDHQLDNFLVPTGSRPPSSCTVDNPLCTENPVPAESEVGSGTAHTGGDWRLELSLGALLLGSGALLSMAGIKRRRQTG